MTGTGPLSFDVNIAGGGNFGWPILPHGGGAYWNVFGTYIGGAAGPTAGAGETYANFAPSLNSGGTGTNGIIVSAAVNYQNNAGARLPIYACVYGPASPFQAVSIGNMLPGGSGSLAADIFTLAGGGITFTNNDYIGVYVEDVAGGGTPVVASVLVEADMMVHFF